MIARLPSLCNCKKSTNFPKKFWQVMGMDQRGKLTLRALESRGLRAQTAAA